jgi:hypothetical protein
LCKKTIIEVKPLGKGILDKGILDKGHKGGLLDKGGKGEHGVPLSPHGLYKREVDESEPEQNGLIF